jgi:tetratricopeptide (TPR) repeat protein
MFVGTKGFIGLTLFYTAMILPVIRFVRRFPVRLWRNPQLAPASVAATLLGLYIIDCLLNGFPNIIYVTITGGLAGLEPRQLRGIVAESGIGAAAAINKSALADHNHRLGRTLKAEGRFKEAKAVWRQTLELLSTLITAHPDHPDLRQRWCDCANDLAWLNLHYPDPASGNPSEAIALARHTVEMCPDGATYWNTLGTAYFRAGDDILAITALDRAKALSDGTAFDDVFLAMAHARLGNREHAEHLLTQAILQMEQDNPGHAELVRFCDEARSILAEGFGAPAVAR